ncbi:hypothetical protein ABNQ39_20660 [Azospirillum sp. A26]|uniref:hypothetical protein n=1 Tax=Azospirillum sp. A26 TaxID=3160607 RepID=UPI00366A7400
MPDPAVSTEAVVGVAGGGTLALLGRMAWDFWRGLKATARDDRRTEQADKVESAAIKQLEAHLARMEKAQEAAEARHKAEIEGLYKRIAEQDAKIEELTDRLTDAIDDRLKAIEEASRLRGDHVQLETRLMQEIGEHTSLARSHADFVQWVRSLSLPDDQRCSPIYLRAMNWYEHYRTRL